MRLTLELNLLLFPHTWVYEAQLQVWNPAGISDVGDFCRSTVHGVPAGRRAAGAGGAGGGRAGPGALPHEHSLVC